MPDFSDLYERPLELTAEWGHHRIYAPQAYAKIRTARTLPIVLQEAASLAQWYPVCWRQRASGMELVALMHLLPDDRRRLAAIQGGFPLIAQAYPYVVPSTAEIERKQLFVDRSIADRPTDIGAPLVLDTGRLSKASLVRARTAYQAGRAMQETRFLTADLEAAGFFEPWPLRFDLENGCRIDIDDLFVISAKKFSDPLLYPLVQSYGPDAGLFLAYSRISLFRTMNLIATAKSAIERDGKETQEATAYETVMP
jgi:SapC